MKKLLTYAFMLSILAYCVLAADANIYEAKDFTKHPEQLVILEERDIIRLNWGDKEHQLMVRQVYPEKQKVDLTAFIEGAEVPYYASINPKTSLQLDFDRDNNYDLKVSIFNILKDEKIIALKLQKIEETSQEIITGEAIEEKSGKLSVAHKTYIIIGFTLLVLALVIWKRKSVFR